MGYVLAVQATNPMREKALWAQMEVAVWRRFSAQDYCVYDEWRHQAGTWEKPIRMIANASVDGSKSEARYVVTHSSEATAKEVYHRYTQRGDAENRIKEFELDLVSGASCPLDGGWHPPNALMPPFEDAELDGYAGGSTTCLL